MDPNFAHEYSRKTDADLILLLRDKKNLLPMAQTALQVELSRRKLTEKSFQDDEPVAVEEPELDESENTVTLNAERLRFPKMCPRCLSREADSIVRISYQWDSLAIWFQVIAIWRYVFSRCPVPFCSKCARSILLRRLVISMGFLSLVVSLLAYDGNHGLGKWGFLLLFFGITGAAWGLWILLGMNKRWPGEGIEILSTSRDRQVWLEFSQPEYQTEFIKLNRSDRGSAHRQT